MTQPTIEQLVDEIINKAELMTIRMDDTPEVFEKAKSNTLVLRSALLSRIALLQTEADDWKEDAERLEHALADANAEKFPVSWEDASETSYEHTLHMQLEDKYNRTHLNSQVSTDVKIWSDNNKPSDIEALREEADAWHKMADDSKSELKTLRFKTSEQDRFIWWIWNVYAKNVNDLILSIISATTYDNETMAKLGKYGLPIKCFEIMERVKKGTDGIYDGTYLDVS